METIDLLEEALKENTVREGRAQGNTTRLVNMAVEYLYQKKAVILRDHYDHKEADMMLLDLVKERLDRQSRRFLTVINDNSRIKIFLNR